MGQVTIYVEDSALDAAKRSAERSKVSVSQWFAKFAIEERQKQLQSWDAFFAEIEPLRGQDNDDGLDFLLGADRYKDLGTDIPREPF